MPPGAHSPLRWGIAGTGALARLVAPAFTEVPEASLIAVGSRSSASANAFGDAYGVPHRHASYEALAADPSVDVIHVATPNAFHAAHAIMFLRAGKAVLIEKPIAVDGREARAIAAAAGEAGRFAMEAMWTRFVPAVRRAREWIEGGRIGAVHAVEASFGFRAEPHELPALLSKALCVGSLRDVGVYPISLAHMAFGRAPDRVIGSADREPGGLDRKLAFILSWDGGGLALGMSSVVSDTCHDAWIAGSAGRIRLHAPFWNAPAATLSRAGEDDERFEAAGGYAHQIRAVTSAVQGGLVEHPWMRLEESIAVMETVDRLFSAA